MNPIQEPSICSVCESELSQNYCPACGQKHISIKPSFFNMLKDILVNLLSLERSLSGTIIKFIRDPRGLVDNYWNGYRNYYSSPGRMIFYTLSIYALHILIFDTTEIFGVTFSISSINPVLGLLSILYVFIYSSSLTLYWGRSSKLFQGIALIYSTTTWIILLIVLFDLASLVTDSLLQEGVILLLFYLIIIVVYHSIILTKKKGIKFKLLNASLHFVIMGLFVTICLILANYLNPGTVSLGL